MLYLIIIVIIYLSWSWTTCWPVPEVSSKVYHDSFCHLGSSISLPWVIYFEAFYLHVVSSFSCIPVIAVLFFALIQKTAVFSLWCNDAKSRLCLLQKSWPELHTDDWPSQLQGAASAQEPAAGQQQTGGRSYTSIGSPQNVGNTVSIYSYVTTCTVQGYAFKTFPYEL